MTEFMHAQQLVLQNYVKNHRFCEKSKRTEGHFSLFPVSTLQAVFHNDGTDNELSITSASPVPHIQNTKLGRPAFLQHLVSVTDVVILNLLVWTVPDTGRAAGGFGGSWHASVYR